MSVADLAPGQHATRVHDHWWWRPGWRVGRHFYAFHITFDGQPDLYRLAATYRDALAGLPALTVVPDRWLHLTVQGLGFTDELSRSTVDAIASEAAARLAEVPPVAVRFAEIVVADEAIALPAMPAEPIRRIRDTSRAAIASVMQEVPEDPQRFRPHVTLAYLTADGSSDPYVTAVRAVNAEPAPVTVGHLDLIEMHRDHRMYEWNVLASIKLGAPRTNDLG
jgi:2'-5' RNA ligase